jgi:uncharacterized protein (TIGR02001 family)
MRVLKASPLLALVLAALVAALAPCAARGEVVPAGFVGVTSDYVLRGVSLSNGQPALQGDLHLSLSGGWSAGFWSSQVRLVPHSVSAELDAYLQWHGAVSEDFDLSAVVTHYSYPGDPRPVSYSYDELGTSLSWRDEIYVTASWSPRVNLYSYEDGLVRNQQVFSIDATVHRSVLPRLDISAGVGFYYPPGLAYGSYSYGNAALDWHQGHWRADLAFIWAQSAAHRHYAQGPAGGPLALSVAWVF